MTEVYALEEALQIETLQFTGYTEATREQQHPGASHYLKALPARGKSIRLIIDGKPEYSVKVENTVFGRWYYIDHIATGTRHIADEAEAIELLDAIQPEKIRFSTYRDCKKWEAVPLERAYGAGPANLKKEIAGVIQLADDYFLHDEEAGIFHQITEAEAINTLRLAGIPTAELDPVEYDFQEHEA